MSDYNMHMTLRKLGYSFDPNHLDCTLADCFFIVANEISKIESEELKRARRGR